MKKRFIGAIVVMAVFSCITGSNASQIRGGVIVGDPTGLSARVEKFPILGLAWSISDNWMHIHCDYWIIHKPLSAPLNWYLGAGGALGIGNNVGVGVRVPVGLQFPFEQRWELFGELAPVIKLIESTGFDIQGGIGIRYIF